jgi:protocatechuate 3,4-dioxygenase beta subunit
MRGRGGAEIIAWADGWGMAWTDVIALAPGEPVRIALAPEADVHGTVIDAKGQTVRDARITLGGLTKSTTESRGGSYTQPGDLNLSLSELQRKITTDSEGRFVLRNLPPDYRISAIFEHAGSKRTVIYIDTGNNPELKEIRSRNTAFEVQRSPLKITLQPQRSATVKILDHTGKPVANGAVEMIDDQRHFAGWQAVDERGEVHIPLKAQGKYSVSYGSDPLSPRLGQRMPVEIAAGDDSPTFEIRLPAFAWLAGQVIDADTGKGVVGVSVHYSQKTDDSTEGPGASSMCFSGPEGKFRIPVISGEGQVSCSARFGYFVPGLVSLSPLVTRVPTAKVESSPSGEPVPVTFRLPRGLAVRGRVLTADGKPVADAIIEGESRDKDGRGEHRSTARSNSDGRYELFGLSPNQRTFITVRSDAGGSRAEIEAAPDHPWEKTLWKDLDLRLESSVAIVGRAFFKGEPRAGVTLKLSRSTEKGGLRFGFYGEAKTDAAGQFRLNGLAAGDNFAIEVSDSEGLGDPNWNYAMGRLHKIPEGQAELRLPDLNLITYGQSLSGIVVDPKGTPVADNTIMAQLGMGRSVNRLPNGKFPQTKTGKDGRFELTQLPDLQLQLMTFRANPQGGRIVHPSTIQPTLNQKNLRIVFDPSLTDDVDDIDKPKPPPGKKDG